MTKLDAIKDGSGNIIITEGSFNFLLRCLDDQQYIPHPTLRADYSGQADIDSYKDDCRKILEQRYIFETCEDGYFLFKKYKYQDEIIKWSNEDVSKVFDLFKNNTVIEYTRHTNPRPWLIQRAIRYDDNYLTISEDGQYNRPWKPEEIEEIRHIFNGLDIKENGYYKEELWRSQLSKMDVAVIEKHIRKLKLKKL